MNFIRNAISNTRLQYRISKTINDAIVDSSVDGVMAECRELAETVPDMLLQSLATSFLSPNQPEKAFRAMELLESLVQSCSRVFHLALARSHLVQQKLLAIAMRRVDGTHPFQSRAQRLARLTLLEYSRIFMADPDLQKLSTLAALFESRTKRNLLRALNVQNRHIAFTEPRADDIIMISPRKSIGPKGPTAFLSSSTQDGPSPGSSGMPYATLQEFFAARIDKIELPASIQKKQLPKSMTSPKRWVCPVCQQNNSPMALLCAACETPRLFPEGVKDAEDEEKNAADPCSPSPPAFAPVLTTDEVVPVEHGECERAPLDEEEKNDGEQDVGGESINSSSYDPTSGNTVAHVESLSVPICEAAESHVDREDIRATESNETTELNPAYAHNIPVEVKTSDVVVTIEQSSSEPTIHPME